MGNALCIMRRDLGAYFTSPIGYIFIMVFVTISVGLYMASFFIYPVADMRPYFDNLPLLLCVFVPAVTMRVWAEERKENTWEMLLTFPMKAWELTVGKFLASLVFFALALLATVTVPAMLFSLGNPDAGAILGGYLGTLLLGAFFLALGIFFSGFFKDQIVAFVVTLLTCFLFFLLGTEFIASYIDGRVAGLGSLLYRVMGIFTHFTPFTRGIVDLADVVFFLAWTALFLSLNVFYIDGRNRPGARVIFSAAVGICVAIGFVFNALMAGASFSRFDLTQDKIFTVSKASQQILRELDTPARIYLYITPQQDMPTGLKDLERNVTDKLEELRIASGGMIDFSTVYLDAPAFIKAVQSSVFPDPEAEEEKSEEKIIEERMLDKGVEPFNVRAMSQDEVTSKLIYSSIGVAYKDRPEEILPQILPQQLDQLEYRLVTTIYKLAREDRPVVALVAPKDSVDPEFRRMMQQFGQPVPAEDDPYDYVQQLLLMEKYDVRRVELTKESPLPDEYDTLVVLNPQRLNDRQRWEIARALHSGKSVVLGVQNFKWEYRATREGNTITRRDEQPGVNELIGEFGVKVGEDILMDANKVPMQVQGGGTLQDMLMGGQTFNLPMQILVNNASMDQDSAVTNRLSAVFYLWGSALELDEAKLKELGLEAQVLMTSSDQSWTVPGTAQLTAQSFETPAGGMQARPLLAMITGQFPDVFADQERPAWPKPQPQPGQPPAPDFGDDEPGALPVDPAPGKLMVLGCSEMFRKNFLQGANLDLFMNMVDAVTLDDKIVQVRGQKPIDRTISAPTDGQKTLWRLVNYGLANVVIAAAGIGIAFWRRMSRDAYTMAHVND